MIITKKIILSGLLLAIPAQSILAVDDYKLCSIDTLLIGSFIAVPLAIMGTIALNAYAKQADRKLVESARALVLESEVSNGDLIFCYHQLLENGQTLDVDPASMINVINEPIDIYLGTSKIGFEHYVIKKMILSAVLSKGLIILMTKSSLSTYLAIVP